MKTILFIALNFYPSASASAKRIGKFCKYLPRFNYNPIVLTIKKKYYENVDNSLEIEKLDIYRTNTLLAKRPRPSKTFYLFRMLVFYFMRCIEKYSFPDKYIFWLPFAIIKANYIIKSKRVDQIYATGPWFSTFIIGYLLKKIYKIMLIIEFRDQWSLNVVYKRGKSAILHKYFDKKIMKNADKIIFTSNGFFEQYKREYPKLGFNNVEVIQNSYDPDDFKGTETMKEDRFVVTYAGNFYWPRNPDAFLKALSVLRHERKINRNNFKFINIGNLQKNKIVNDDVKCLIEYKGKLSHNKTISYLKGSDLLLLIVAHGHEKNIPAKIYEYMAIGKPIFVLSPEGAVVEEIIKYANCGVVANINDINDIKEKLFALYKNDKRNSIYKIDRSKLIDFSCLKTTKQLANILSTLTATIEEEV